MSSEELGLALTEASDMDGALVEEYRRNVELSEELMQATMDIVALRKLAEARAPFTIPWSRKPLTTEAITRDLQWRWRRGRTGETKGPIVEPVAAEVNPEDDAGTSYSGSPEIDARSEPGAVAAVEETVPAVAEDAT